MLGLFKRNRTATHNQPGPAAVDPHDRAWQEKQAARMRRSAMKRDLQLRLHAHQIFPSAIRVLDDGEWAEVQFSPAHPRSVDAPAVLRELHRQGMIQVAGLGSERPDATWTVRLRLMPRYATAQ